MRISKLSLSFTKYTDAELETKAAHILDCMTANLFFVEPVPVPALTDVKAALTKYSLDLLAAKNLGRTNVAAKDQSRKQLQPLLSQLGVYVMLVANGDKPALISSGFTLLKEHEPSYITNPGNVTLSNGISSGQMVASAKSVKGSKSCVFGLSLEMPGEDTLWMDTTTSASKYVYKDLVPGKQYWVRVAVVGSRGQVAYSPVASMFVQ